MKTMQKMKEVIIAVALVLVMNLSFGSCIATRDTTKINKVEIGMTKSDVKKLLGTPLFRNANEEVEEWGYRKSVGEIVDPEQMIFIVTFDNDGKVTAYQSVKEHPSHHSH